MDNYRWVDDCRHTKVIPACGSCDDPGYYELTNITQAHMVPDERPLQILLKKRINMSMFHDMSEDPSKRVRWNQRASLSIMTNNQTSRPPDAGPASPWPTHVEACRDWSTEGNPCILYIVYAEVRHS
ncbi:hypothetical protein GGS26DRAFT_402458 [Hypomontagnella submonticulosa]|nr:hypothetical protein GGS26DRAFT_402458 [Hypomontagnella submonticulosa]